MKNRIQLIIVLLFTSSIFSFAQSELVIEVRTDNYPEETHWTLYDVLRNVVGENGTLEKETMHRDTFLLDDTKCYYWTIYDEYDGIGSGIHPGDYKLYLNGNLVAECKNPNFVDSVSVYNLGSVCSANDVGVLNMTMLYYLSKDKEDIKANVVNMGVVPITSIELFYKVDDFTSATVEVSGLLIPIGEVYEVIYPTPHDFTTAGEYNIEFTITKVNGENDGNDINNSVSMDVKVLDGYVQYNVIEDIMSYECGPCWDAMAKFDETLPHFPGTQSLIKYMIWDFADTKYFDEQKLDDIQDYYDVRGVPHIRLNGVQIDYRFFTSTFYLDYIGLVTPVKLSLTSNMVGDSLITSIKVVSNIDINKELVLRLLPMENECFDVSLNADNSKPFHNVVYDIYNGIDGISIESLKAGEEKEFIVKNSIVNYPFEQGSFDDMAALVYLQEVISKEIYQSIQVNAPYTKVDFKLSYNVDDNATDVDTTGLIINVSSNRYLLKENGNNIGNIKDHLNLRKNSETGVSVPFDATINDDKNLITVIPTYGWETNSTYYFEVNNFSTIDGLHITTDNITFTTKNYIGVSEKYKNSVTIYPNPASSNLSISLETDSQIIIIDVSGKEVARITGHAGQNKIDVSNYNTGVYFVKVNNNFGTQTTKFIKEM